MGFMDKVKEQAAEQQAAKDAAKAERAEQTVVTRQAAASVTAACPGGHYVTEVNKGSINMGRWQAHLNDMFGRGYKLAHVVEQDGNTVQVYEHHFH